MENSLFSAYSNVTSLEHRKKFGQFFTPKAIAKFMIDWLLIDRSDSCLDTAFGLGVFAEELDASNYNFASFKTYELDSHIFDFSKNYFGEKITIHNKDYLLNWDNPKFDSIICNPPYMKFQNFQSKEEVIEVFEENLGIRLSGYTNTASAFLLKSIEELKDGGKLAYIMPFEFMNAGYGQIVKEFLLEQGTINALIKIDCEKDTFSEVVTSVGIIFFTKQNKSTHDIPFYVITSLSQLTKLDDLTPIRSVSRNDIKPKDKWAKHFELNQITINSKWLCQLNYYGSFSRGIATGANEYFSANQTKAKKFKLPEGALIPCITKSNQLKTSIFSSEKLEKLILSDATIYLVNLEENSDCPAIKSYIKLGEEREVHKRYLTKMRSPWYKLEKRKPAELLFGVFSRDGYKVVRNFTNSINLTCYHGFNTNMFGAKYLDLLFFYFLSGAGKKILTINMRKYGDGLDKFEPNDLNNSFVPSSGWFDSLKEVDIAYEYSQIRKNGKISEKLNCVFDSLLH